MIVPLLAMVIYFSYMGRAGALVQRYGFLESRRAIRLHTSRAGAARYVDTDEKGMKKCEESIRAGRLVAFPTETVYGLGADAEDEAAVRSIFTAKARPHTDPLIVHVLGKERIYDFFDFNHSEKGDSQAKRVCEVLCEAFWPGPLTLVYKASSRIPPLITASTGFVGLRSPRHPIARQLLSACEPIAIAAPSANRFGHVSPTSASHVMDDLGGIEDLLILKTPKSESEADCDVGIESTVCSVSEKGEKVTILRCGAVGAQAITSALKEQQIDAEVNVDNERNGGSHKGEGDNAAVSPGQLLKHYAPDVTTYVVSATTLRALHDGKAEAGPLVEAVRGGASILDFSGSFTELKIIQDKNQSSFYRDLSPSGDVEEACKKLFVTLREAEDARQILLLPDLKSTYLKGTQGEGPSNDLMQALWERLLRASSGKLL